MKMAARSSSSSSIFGSTGGEDNNENKQMFLQQFSSTTTTTTSSPSAPTQAPPKKRRNQPGTPNPDAEIVALSPRTLMATNRFICEVCNKGFQREQNLQLHRRGHNLPWRLKQKSNKLEAKKKVYVCPETTCVHHDPSRALGDLTGIKKHFFRKHGEKKWKCDKCSKRYAVHSDWKAHSKTCGTREYRCDCGTLFSRRDSFITHRAFCDALTQEGARNPSNLNAIRSQLYGNNPNRMSLGLSQLRSPQISSFQEPSNNNPSNNMFIKQHIPTPTTQAATLFFMQDAANHQLGFQDQHQPASHAHTIASFASKPLHHHQHGLTQLPDLQTNTNNDLFNLGFFSGHSSSSATTNPGFLSPITHQFSSITGNVGDQEIAFFSTNNVGENNQVAGGAGVSYSLFSPCLENDNASNNNAHMSATTLLQKAANIGSTASAANNNSTTLLGGLACSSSSDNVLGGQQIENDNNLQGLMNSLVNGAGSSNIFGEGQAQNGNPSTGYNANFGNFDEAVLRRNLAVSIGGSDRLTLDFLGVGGIVRNVGSNRGGPFYRRSEQQLDVSISNSSLDAEMKSSLLAGNAFGRD